MHALLELSERSQVKKVCRATLQQGVALVQVAVVLVRDQDLGDVPARDLAEFDEVVAKTFGRLRDRGHVSAGPYPSRRVSVT